jgi:hypothetical protein
MSTHVIDATIPDPVLDEIAVIPNPENLAIALHRYPLLDPHNPAIVKIAAELPDGYWVSTLRQHLADLAKLDAKALQKLHKKLQKAPVNPLNIWIDVEEPVAAVMPVAKIKPEIGEVSTATTVTGFVSAVVTEAVTMANAKKTDAATATTETVDMDEVA